MAFLAILTLSLLCTTAVATTETVYTSWWRANSVDESHLTNPTAIVNSMMMNRTDLFSTQTCPQCPQKYSSCDRCRTSSPVSIPEVTKVQLRVQCEMYTRKRSNSISTSDMLAALASDIGESKHKVSIVLHEVTAPLEHSLTPSVATSPFQLRPTTHPRLFYLPDVPADASLEALSALVRPPKPPSDPPPLKSFAKPRPPPLLTGPYAYTDAPLRWINLNAKVTWVVPRGKLLLTLPIASSRSYKELSQVLGALEQNCTRHIRTEVVVRTTNRDKEGPLSRLMNFTAAGYLKVDGWEVDTPLPRAAKMLSAPWRKNTPTFLEMPKSDLLQYLWSVISKRGATGRRLNAVMAKEATATLPSDFYTKCDEYCHGGAPNVHTQYYANPSSRGEIMGNIFSSSGAVIISGVLDVQLTGHTGGLEICPQRTCTMTVQIPVNASKYDQSKSMLCMRIEEGKAIGGCDTSGICFTGYNETSGLATCETNMLGDMFLLQYDSTSPTSVTDKQAVEEKSITKQVKLIFTFSGDYATLAHTQDLPQGVKENLAAYADVDKEHVEIKDIRQGSIILDVIIHFPFDRSEEELMQLTNIIIERPQEIFRDEFIEEFGIPTVQKFHPAAPSTKEFTLGKRFKIAGITLAICLFFTGIIVVLIFDDEKKSAEKKKSPLIDPQPPSSSETELGPLGAT